MRILIIGNGFDLNLGLKTGYKDFITSKYFKTLVKNRNPIAEYFNEKNELNSWVDIEKELTEYSIIVKNKNLDIKENFEEIKLALINYLKEAQEKEINQDSIAFKLLKEEIHTIDLIFNFNYTNSIFEIAKILNIQNIETKHHYIHGSIKKQDIIFGVEDDAKIYDEHKFLKKASNKNHVRFGVLKEFEENNIIIFGHSLGITDSSYFKKYIHERAINVIQTEFKFYYYDNLGWEEMIKIIDEYTKNQLTGFRANNFIPLDSSL